MSRHGFTPKSAAWVPNVCRSVCHPRSGSWARRQIRYDRNLSWLSSHFALPGRFRITYPSRTAKGVVERRGHRHGPARASLGRADDPAPHLLVHDDGLRDHVDVHAPAKSLDLTDAQSCLAGETHRRVVRRIPALRGRQDPDVLVDLPGIDLRRLDLVEPHLSEDRLEVVLVDRALVLDHRRLVLAADHPLGPVPRAFAQGPRCWPSVPPSARRTEATEHRRRGEGEIGAGAVERRADRLSRPGELVTIADRAGANRDAGRGAGGDGRGVGADIGDGRDRGRAVCRLLGSRPDGSGPDSSKPSLKFPF